MNKNLGSVAWQSCTIATLTIIGVQMFECDREACSASAQVIPDDTLGDESSVVNPRDETSDSIDGGALRGQNLFHSFQEFNVDAGRGVYFANPEAVSNIFSRVTGNNVSNILGTLGVDGAANLFLINPNGIIFGEDASLDVQGSFYGSTADSILFPNGIEFSATDTQPQPILTINVPIALGLGSNPGVILVEGNGLGTRTNNDLIDTDNALRINSASTLGLIGGNLNLEGATLKTDGGRIELSSIASNERVGLTPIDNNFSLDYEGVENFENITLSQSATVDASGSVGGDVRVRGKNLTLTEGSTINASTLGNVATQETPGAIEINIRDTVSFDGQGSNGSNSGATSLINTGAVGDAGSVNIETGSLILTNGGIVDASTSGRGDAGRVTINATDTVSVDGEDPTDDETVSGIFSGVNDGATGNAGGVEINTGNLALINAGTVSASTFGRGNAGKVTINATDNISIDGQDLEGFNSGAYSQVAPGALGDAGGVNITTGSLTLTNGGGVSASVFGEGDAGRVSIKATDTVSVDGEDPTDNETVGGISSNVLGGAIGNAGGVEINTRNLTLTNAGTVSASTFGRGNAGQVTINATNTISVDGEDLEGFNSGAYSQVAPGALGDAGGVNITTSSLTLTNGGRVDASTLGEGNAGLVEITAKDTVSFDGESSNGFLSGATSQVSTGTLGDAGGVTITTGSLTLTNGGRVDASTFGQGNAGSVKITARDTVSFDGESSNGFPSGATSQVNTGALGDAGGVNITTGSLTLTNGGRVDASTFGQGNAGSVKITARNMLDFDGEDSNGFPSGVTSLVLLGAVGNAGGVTIETGSLTLTNGGRVGASTFGEGNAGSIKITARDTLDFDGQSSEGFASGATSQVSTGAAGEAGDVIINTGSLTLTSGGLVSASTFSEGNAGDVTIFSQEGVNLFDGKIFSGVEAGGVGNGGDVEIQTDTLSLINGSQVGAFVFRAENDVPGGKGDGGNINIIARDSIDIYGVNEEGFSSGLVAITEQGAEGRAGNITVSTNTLRISNSGELTSGTRNSSNGGNIIINANILEAVEGGQVRVTSRDAGNAGNITLNITDRIFLSGSDPTFFDVLERFDENRVSEAGPASGIFSNATEASTGNAGSLSINTEELIVKNTATIDVSNQGQGNAGALNINSSFIELDGRGTVTASTSFGEGGNMFLNVNENGSSELKVLN